MDLSDPAVHPTLITYRDQILPPPVVGGDGTQKVNEEALKKVANKMKDWSYILQRYPNHPYYPYLKDTAAIVEKARVCMYVCVCVCV
jgi:hypothetical protein